MPSTVKYTGIPNFRRYTSIAFVVFVLFAFTGCGTKRKVYKPNKKVIEFDENTVVNPAKLAYTPLKYQAEPEMRAVWLTTIYGLDWPKTRGTSAQVQERQREEFRKIIAELKQANFNTVFLQVRLRGDLLYPSALEPQADILTGSTVAPNYDPLAFAIEECHKRGIALHAWIVTYPLGRREQVNKLGARGVAKRHPNWVVQHNGEYYLNPGLPEVRSYLTSLVSDLISRYNVDGIHFDYIRYPEKAGSFRDDNTYQQYRKPGQSKAAWREANINQLLSDVAATVERIRPTVLISAALLGRYREIPGKKYTGWTAKESVHQAPKAWFRQKSIDFVVPMMYYKNELFDPYIRDWKEQMNGGIVIPGLGAYRTQDNSNWNCQTIEQQITLLRQEGLKGVCFYRQENIRGTHKNLYNIVCQAFTFPVRPLPFFERTAPLPSMPIFQYCEIVKDTLILSWLPSKANDGTTSYNLFFNLYDKNGNPGEDYLLAPSIRGNQYRIPLAIFPKSGKIHFRLEAANAFNHVGRASLPLVIDLKHKSFT